MLEYTIILAVGLLVLYTLVGVFSGNFVGVNGSATLSGRELNYVQELFFRTVFTLLGYVAKRDGPINKTEVKRTEIFMEKMDLDAAHKREAIRLFKQGAGLEFNADPIINDFKGLAKKSPNLTQILLVYLVNLARVDGELDNKEITAIQKVALGLGYTSITFNHLLKMIASQNTFGDFVKKQTESSQDKKSSQSGKAQSGNGKSSKTSGDSAEKSQGDSESCEEKTRDFQSERASLDTAYEVLGISKNANHAEVKKAYRLMSSQFHPDKLMGQGLPSYMIQSATECFKTIQAAYEYINKSREKNA